MFEGYKERYKLIQRTIDKFIDNFQLYIAAPELNHTEYIEKNLPNRVLNIFAEFIDNDIEQQIIDTNKKSKQIIEEINLLTKQIEDVKTNTAKKINQHLLKTSELKEQQNNLTQQLYALEDSIDNQLLADRTFIKQQSNAQNQIKLISRNIGPVVKNLKSYTARIENQLNHYLDQLQEEFKTTNTLLKSEIPHILDVAIIRTKNNQFTELQMMKAEFMGLRNQNISLENSIKQILKLCAGPEILETAKLEDAGQIIRKSIDMEISRRIEKITRVSNKNTYNIASQYQSMLEKSLLEKQRDIELRLATAKKRQTNLISKIREATNEINSIMPQEAKQSPYQSKKKETIEEKMRSFDEIMKNVEMLRSKM